MNPKSRNLRELLSSVGVSVPASVPAVDITQLTDDSRAIRPGGFFVAVRGSAADGHWFIGQAAANGAAAALVEEPVPALQGLIQIQVPSTRLILGPLAHAFQGSPSARLRMVGVTGTKGKTTVAWLIQHLLESAGISCGLLGTVCNRLGDGETTASDNTTPGAAALQAHLALMCERGLKACAMEVSSHALEQNRVDGIRWSAAVFTQLAPEHLDYHLTMEAYFQAKLRLFQALGPEATAILNAADPASVRIRPAVRGKVLTYTLDGAADLSVRNLKVSLEGFSCDLVTPSGIFPARSGLIGRHNVENLLVAAGTVLALDAPLGKALSGLPEFPGVPGRLERVDAGQPFPVFVDYAHTDGALRRILEELRRVTDRKILTVFGCGGNRDRTKRPRMGKAAAELSDRVLVTSDNPRSEDPGAIAREIAAGMGGAGAEWEICLDRREAIRRALEQADEGWLVLIAGKGHETTQIFADRTVPFDDRAVVRELLGRPSFVQPRLF